MLSNFLFRLQIEKLYLQSSNFTLLGVDLGTRYTGISVSDQALKKAHVQSIDNQTLYDVILKGCKKNNSRGIVIGQPNDDVMGKYCETFAQRLADQGKTLNLIVTTINEDCTTNAARHIAQKVFNRENDKELLDSLASVLILQQFLDQLKLPQKKK